MESECVKSRKAEGVVKGVYCGALATWSMGQGASQASSSVTYTHCSQVCDSLFAVLRTAGQTWHLPVFAHWDTVVPSAFFYVK